MYMVYVIKVKGMVRYVGITDDVKRRQTQHNYLLNKGAKKLFYNFCRINQINTLELIVVFKSKSKLEAARYEAHLILLDYFSDKFLHQSPPKTMKYHY